MSLQQAFNSLANTNKYQQMYVKNFVDISGNLVLRNSGCLYVTGDASINRVFVNNDVSFGGNLFVNGKAIFNTDLSVNSRVFFPPASINASAISGLNVSTLFTTDVSCNARLFVNSDTSMNGNLVVQKTAIFNTDLSVNSRVFFPAGSIAASCLSGNIVAQGGSVIRNDTVFYDEDGFEQQYYGGSFTVASGGSVVRNDTIVYDVDGFEKTWNGGNFTVATPSLTVIGDLSAAGRLFMLGDLSVNQRLFVVGDTSHNGNIYTGGRIGIGNAPTAGILDISGSVIRNVVTASGYLGIGKTNPSTALDVSGSGVFSSGVISNGSVQNTYKLLLSGQEFYGAAVTDTNGIALLAGVNRTDNRQFWIADSARLAQDTSNGVFRIGIGPLATSIGSIATNGTTSLPLTINARTIGLMGGYVGIGTSNPIAPLNITTSGSGSYGGNYYNLFNSTTIGSSSTLAATTGCSFYAVGDVVSRLSFISNCTFTASDIRIKKNINIVDKNNSLNIFRQLKPVTHQYIDKVINNSSNTYGFIAQDVVKILPEAIQFREETIPNIFEIASIKNNIITLNDKNTDILEKDVSGNYFDISIYILKKDENKEDNEIVKIKSIIDNKSFEIEREQLVDSKTLFVYGQKVNNYHYLNKEVIFSLATSVIQSLDDKVQEQQKTIEDLQSTLQQLTKTVETLQQQVNLLQK